MRLLELPKIYKLSHPCLKPGTLDQYARACRSLSRSCTKSMQLLELSKAAMLQWIARRLEEVSARTVKRERGDVLTLWRFAFAEGYHPLNPDTLRIPTITVPRKSPVCWELADVEKLLGACDTLDGNMRGLDIQKADWWRSLVLFLYDTGARPSAALQVMAADISLSCGSVTLRGEVAKTGCDTVCMLSDQTIKAIKLHFDPSQEFVWPWPCHRRQLWATSKRLNHLAGLPEDRYHSLGCMRRTAASYTAAHGSIEMAQRLLGHTSATTTLRHYIDPRIAQQQSAIDVLPRPKF